MVTRKQDTLILLTFARQVDLVIKKYINHSYSFADRVMHLDRTAERSLEALQKLLRGFNGEPEHYIALAVKASLNGNFGNFHPLDICSKKTYSEVRYGGAEELYFSGGEKPENKFNISLPNSIIEVMDSLKDFSEEKHFVKLKKIKDVEELTAYTVLHRTLLHPVLLYDLDFIREYWEEAGESFSYGSFNNASLEHKRLSTGGAQQVLRKHRSFNQWTDTFNGYSLFGSNKKEFE